MLKYTGIRDFKFEDYIFKSIWKQISFKYALAQTVVALECTDCISAERSDSPNECPAYDTKQYDGDAPVMQKLRGMCSTTSFVI